MPSRDNYFVCFYTPNQGFSRLNASSFVTYLHFHYNSVIQSNLSLLYFLLREHIWLQFHQRLKPILVSPRGILQLASPFISTAYPTERQRNLNNGGSQHNCVIQGDDRIIRTYLNTRSKFPQLAKEATEEAFNGKFIEAVYLSTRWRRHVL